jgi:8-oxo-dGTP pyrophosphatase MutT (NUDIX family)
LGGFVHGHFIQPTAANMTPPRIKDPKAFPVAGVDSHLPALLAQQLSAHAVRQRFVLQRDWRPEHAGDGERFKPVREPAFAAVLVPLVQRPSGLHVLLTQRTDHLHDHAGQISFPGGRTEPEDGSPEATALREAEEEVGLAHEHVQVIGRMPVYTTVTNFVVTPVVALVEPHFTLNLDTFEVAEAFEVPLAFLMNPANHRRHAVPIEGGERHFLSMPWQGQGPSSEAREYFIWGATAAMLRNLYRFLAD